MSICIRQYVCSKRFIPSETKNKIQIYPSDFVFDSWKLKQFILYIHNRQKTKRIDFYSFFFACIDANKKKCTSISSFKIQKKWNKNTEWKILSKKRNLKKFYPNINWDFFYFTCYTQTHRIPLQTEWKTIWQTKLNW